MRFFSQVLFYFYLLFYLSKFILVFCSLRQDDILRCNLLFGFILQDNLVSLMTLIFISLQHRHPTQRVNRNKQCCCHIMHSSHLIIALTLQCWIWLTQGSHNEIGKIKPCSGAHIQPVIRGSSSSMCSPMVWLLQPSIWQYRHIHVHTCKNVMISMRRNILLTENPHPKQTRKTLTGLLTGENKVFPLKKLVWLSN